VEEEHQVRKTKSLSTQACCEIIPLNPEGKVLKRRSLQADSIEPQEEVFGWLD
jgi:hypothetical protein